MNFNEPVEFSFVLFTVFLILVATAIGIFFVKAKTKKLKD